MLVLILMHIMVVAWAGLLFTLTSFLFVSPYTFFVAIGIAFLASVPAGLMIAGNLISPLNRYSSFLVDRGLFLMGRSREYTTFDEPGDFSDLIETSEARDFFSDCIGARDSNVVYWSDVYIWKNMQRRSAQQNRVQPISIKPYILDRFEDIKDA